ncbi:hypothetical protein ACWGOK_40455 [Streptomyces eurythermus]
MSTGRIHETDAVERGGIGRRLTVTVLDDDGTHAVIRAQDSGLYLKAGDTRTVPSNIITPQS